MPSDSTQPDPNPPQPGEFWDRLTDPVMLLIQRIRVASSPQGGWVWVQTERVSGKLGKLRRVRLSHFGTGKPGHFYRAKVR